MQIKDVINIDPDILNGQPVFTGTRVPVETLFDPLAQVFPPEIINSNVMIAGSLVPISPGGL